MLKMCRWVVNINLFHVHERYLLVKDCMQISPFFIKVSNHGKFMSAPITQVLHKVKTS